VKIEPLFCAPTAAATDVLRKEGFEAKTLQSLLLTKPKLDERRLVVLDEAGAVGRHPPLQTSALLRARSECGFHCVPKAAERFRNFRNHSERCGMMRNCSARFRNLRNGAECFRYDFAP